MRAPSLDVDASPKGVTRRTATIHYHGSTKAEEARGVAFAPGHFTIEASVRSGECQPNLKIRQPEHLPTCAPDCNVSHWRPFLHLACDETIALGALAEITVESEPEDSPVNGNAGDEEAQAWVREQLAQGNEWAWCIVTVRARWAGFEGSDTLGGCSYASRNAFVRPGGYYDDMVRTALENLARAIEEAGSR